MFWLFVCLVWFVGSFGWLVAYLVGGGCELCWVVFVGMFGNVYLLRCRGVFVVVVVALVCLFVRAPWSRAVDAVFGCCVWHD